MKDRDEAKEEEDKEQEERFEISGENNVASNAAASAASNGATEVKKEETPSKLSAPQQARKTPPRINGTSEEALPVDSDVARLDSDTEAAFPPSAEFGQEGETNLKSPSLEETQQRNKIKEELENKVQAGLGIAIGIPETNTNGVGNDQQDDSTPATNDGNSAANELPRSTGGSASESKKKYYEALNESSRTNNSNEHPSSPRGRKMQPYNPTTELAHQTSRDDQSLVAGVNSLLDRLNSVDRTNSQAALEAIDAILLEERQRQQGGTSQSSSSAPDRGNNNETPTPSGAGAATDTRESLVLSDLQSMRLEDLEGDFLSDLPESNRREQRRRSTLSRPNVSDALDEEGNPQPGAYSSRQRPFGQLPSWGGYNSGRQSTTFRRSSFFQRSFGALRRLSSVDAPPSSRMASQMEIQAVLVEEGNETSEEQIRSRVTEEVRREVVSEIMAETVDAVEVNPDDIKARKRRFIMCGSLIVVLVAVIIGLSVGLTQSDSSSSSSLTSPDAVIATVPETICYDRFPGQGHSLGVLCEAEETMEQGGGVPNVVCKAWLDQMESADFCITNAGACRADFAMGDFLRRDATVMLPFDNTLEIIELTGDQVVQSLNDGICFALDPLFGTTGAYPYGHAIRYDVDASIKRISNVQVNPRMEQDGWAPIEMNRVYRVVTHSFLAGGGDNYFTLAGIPEDKRNRTRKDWAEALVEYALEAEVISDLPLTEYSTQNYTQPPRSEGQCVA